VLLSQVIENITKKEFSKSIEDLIIIPLKLENTGFVHENEITKHVAYGYHNYSFGEGEDDKANVYRRSGSIDGFNSEIMVNKNFDKILIILCNTDTADLQNLANRIYLLK